MNNYSSYNTINPNSLNSNTLGQFQNSIKYHYTYPDQARILEPHERKRTNFSNTNNNNTISSTPTAAAFISFNNNNNQLSLKSYESEKLNTTISIRPPPHSMPASRQIDPIMTVNSAGTAIDLKKYGTANFVGFNKLKPNIPSIPPPTPSISSHSNNISNFTSQSLSYSKGRFVNMNQYQNEREKYFAEYIKNNGDAASLIVSPYLYLGGHRSVNNVNSLITQGVTHILNMASELKLDIVEMNKNNIKLLHIPAKDAKTYNIRSDFDRAFHFIDDVLKSKGKIIINCARGISRSATIVIGYLMFRYNMRLVDAFNYTLSKRPQVRPNSNFRRQLEIYEQELIYNRYKIQMRAKTLGFMTPMPQKIINNTPSNLLANNMNNSPSNFRF